MIELSTNLDHSTNLINLNLDLVNCKTWKILRMNLRAHTFPQAPSRLTETTFSFYVSDRRDEKEGGGRKGGSAAEGE